MGRRGPPRTPTKTLAERGSWLAATRSDEARFPSCKRTSCPKGLDGRARHRWRRTYKLLTEAGVLSTADEGILERYCVMWSRWKSAEDYVNRKGLFVVNTNKEGFEYTQEAPWVKLASRMSDQLLRLETQLGLSPASRSSVASDTVDERPKGGIDLNPFSLGPSV